MPLKDAADAGDAVSDALDVVAVLDRGTVGDTAAVTGVRCTVDGMVTLTGDDTGIVVDVGIAPVIAADLAQTLIGMTHQPFRLPSAVYDPAVELGDYVRYGDTVAGVLCAETVTLSQGPRGELCAPDPAELADEYPYIGGAEKALTLAKAYAREAMEALDDDLTQQEIFNRLTDNGAAQGLILYNGQLYVNATYINAGELNADLVHVTNLDASDISSGIIHSNDYQTIVVAMLYPLTTLYPASSLYPNIGEEVVSGFAINFELGRIYGGMFSAEINSLTQAVTALQNSLVYPKSAS